MLGLPSSSKVEAPDDSSSAAASSCVGRSQCFVAHRASSGVPCELVELICGRYLLKDQQQQLLKEPTAGILMYIYVEARLQQPSQHAH